MKKKLGVTRSDNRKALKEAETVWKRFREHSLNGFDIPEATSMAMNESFKPIGSRRESANEKLEHAEITIGVLGYVYNIYDSVISLDIVNRLKEMGVRVKTFEW